MGRGGTLSPPARPAPPLRLWAAARPPPVPAGQWKQCCDELMRIDAPPPRRPPAPLPRQGSLYHEMGERGLLLFLLLLFLLLFLPLFFLLILLFLLLLPGSLPSALPVSPLLSVLLSALGASAARPGRSLLLRGAPAAG